MYLKTLMVHFLWDVFIHLLISLLAFCNNTVASIESYLSERQQAKKELQKFNVWAEFDMRIEIKVPIKSSF
jgi:hypothetical protein